MAFFAFSLKAHAGFFSFLNDIFNQKKQEKTYNSQNISLLEGVSTPETTTGKGGGEITIVNQNALLSDSGPLGTIADIRDKKSNPDQISVYVVREGDNISAIAKMFDVSANTIIWANSLSSGGDITPGQILVILPVSGVQYTIKKGDTIKSVTQKFNGDITEILQFNGLAINDDLIEGQTIIIPNADYSESETEKQTPAPTTTIIKKPKINAPSYAGYYMRPIEGGRKSQKIHGYNAVDLANSCGTPVMAAASGDVLIGRGTGWNAGYGHYIVLVHPNGTQTLYAHLSENIATEGWHVTQGQVIGYIGSTGKSTGCHLHFEIRGAKNQF
jgi:murein DD-endopeptidase MepM/ murein hydrolase activator NlpD